MKQLGILCCFFLALMGEHVIAQTTFKHTATTANIQQNWTYLDHSEINNNPNALLEVTANYGSGVYHTKTIGVWYSAGRWTIFNQDQTPMTVNAQFNVLIAPSGANAFIHTSSETSGHITIINNPRLNNNPNAKFLVTQNWGNAGPYNPNPIGVYYTGGRWAIYNQNFVAMPRNAKFNIFLNDNIFVAEATAITGNHFFIDNPITNNRPAALVFATQYWTSVYNPNEIGVWYSGGRWSVFNQNLIAMPQRAKFMIWSPSASTSTTNTIPAATWRSVLTSLIVPRSSFVINNFTPVDFQNTRDNTYRWYQPDGVRYSIGGGTNRFEGTTSLFPSRVNPFTLYLSDIAGRIQSVSTVGNKLKIVLVFESDGVEARTNCIDNWGCGGFGNPNFNLDNLRLEVLTEPYAQAGQVKLRNIDLKLTGVLNHEGFNFTIAHLQPFLPFFNDQLFQLASTKFTEAVNTPETLASLSTTLNQGIVNSRLFGTSSPYFNSFSLDNNGNLNYSIR